MTATDTRSRRGDGTKPRQRGPNSWEARVRDPNAKGGRRSVWGKTEQEAWDAMRAEQARIIGGAPPLDRRTSVRSVLARWIIAREEAGARANTLASYRSVQRVVEGHRIAHAKVHALTADDVVDFIRDIRKAKGYAPGTLKGFQRVLGAAIQDQVAQGRLGRNVVRHVKLEAADQRDVFPTKAEVAAIMEAAHEYHYGAAIVLPLFAGLRLGEVLGLRWGDIRPQVDRYGTPVPGSLAIHVARNWTRPTGPKGMPAVAGKTKSQAGVRQVPITGSPLLPFLWAVRDIAYGEGVTPHADAWVFPSTKYPGQPLGTRTLEGAWDVVRRRAKVRPVLHFHDLRHGYATELLDRGVPLEVVSVLLGHRDMAFTVRVYGHRRKAVHSVPPDLWAIQDQAGAV